MGGVPIPSLITVLAGCQHIWWSSANHQPQRDSQHRLPKSWAGMGESKMTPFSLRQIHGCTKDAPNKQRHPSLSRWHWTRSGDMVFWAYMPHAGNKPIDFCHRVLGLGVLVLLLLLGTPAKEILHTETHITRHQHHHSSYYRM